MTTCRGGIRCHVSRSRAKTNPLAAEKSSLSVSGPPLAIRPLSRHSDAHRLPPRRLAAHDGHRPLRHAELIREKRDEHRVGLSFHRWRGDSNLERTSVHADDFAFPCAGLAMKLKHH